MQAVQWDTDEKSAVNVGKLVSEDAYIPISKQKFFFKFLKE